MILKPFYPLYSMQMNHHPQRNSVWRLLLFAIRSALVIVTSVSSVIASATLACYLGMQVRGNPSADVGVVMYEYPERGPLLWVVAFPALSFLCLFIIKKYFASIVTGPIGLGFWLVFPARLFAL